MEIKAVKAVTEVTISLTGDEASVLNSMMIMGFSWGDGTRTALLSESLSDSLAATGVGVAAIDYKYDGYQYLEEVRK